MFTGSLTNSGHAPGDLTHTSALSVLRLLSPISDFRKSFSSVAVIQERSSHSKRWQADQVGVKSDATLHPISCKHLGMEVSGLSTSLAMGLLVVSDTMHCSCCCSLHCQAESSNEESQCSWEVFILATMTSCDVQTCINIILS